MNGAPGPDVAGQLIHDIAELAAEHGAFDLALGAPDFEPPAELKAALIEAVDRVSHQYTRTAGSAELCTAIAERLRERFGVAVDPETEVTVTCGVTEATTAALLGLARPGAEVILFEPYFVN